MDLFSIREEILELLDKRRKELELEFIEEDHIYYMKDIDGVVKSDFPSVSKIIKNFYKPFDAKKKALEMSGGDPVGQSKLLAEWREAGDLSTNMGSRVHFELECELIDRYGSYKEVRQPIFEINDEQRRKSDNMIEAGKNFLDLMNDRGAILLDTEIVLGDIEDQYTGQPDKAWLMMNRDKTDFGFVITDYKTNKPKNFEVYPYTDRMYPPFSNYHNTSLTHYYLQLPLYARLLIRMLKNTKYENITYFGGVIVLLKDDKTFQEYRIPKDITEKVFNLDLKKIIKR
jgi:hypothetical protein